MTTAYEKKIAAVAAAESTVEKTEYEARSSSLLFLKLVMDPCHARPVTGSINCQLHSIITYAC